MDSIDMRVMLDQHLLHNHPLLRIRLGRAGKLDEFKTLRVEEAMETRRFMMQGVPENDLNGRAMVDEVVRAQLLDLPSIDEV